MNWAARCPFTLLMALGIISAAIYAGTWQHTIDPAMLARWGFGFHDFQDGSWYSLATSIFFTNRPFMFWGILAFVFGAIGYYEWQAGTRNAILVYFITDLLGNLTLTLAVVYPMYAVGMEVGRELVFSDDVGMSGGGFGCLGACVHTFSHRTRRYLLLIAALYLAFRILFVTELFADLLHILTFPLGYWLSGRLQNPGMETRHD